MSKPEYFFAYCRESIDLASGIEIQKKIISSYAEANNIQIKYWYIDNDRSAYKFRPNFKKLMSDVIEDTNIKGIICSSLSRFGRSASEVLASKHILDTHKKDLVLVKENMDTTTPAGRLQFGIITLFNDFEHDIILERTQAGRAYAILHGTKSGKPMHRPQKKIDWKKFDEYHAKGLSIPAIAKLLDISKVTLYTRVAERMLPQKPQAKTPASP